MGELKGVIIGIVIFVAFIVPFVLWVSIDVVHNQGLMKTTAEVSQLVKKEGGVTSEVMTLVNRLEDNGYHIRFRDSRGNNVYGLVPYGETIFIEYEYTYHNIFGNKTIRTQNKVFNMNRS